MTGWPGSKPHMPPFAYGDIVAPMMLTVAILSALENRDRAGRGCNVDVSQIEAMVHVATDPSAEMSAGKPPEMARHGAYPLPGWRLDAIAFENHLARPEPLGSAFRAG
jgi:benzylsuccinate CoA-transferase BbsF subunit